jgi:hypothetical protein
MRLLGADALQDGLVLVRDAQEILLPPRLVEAGVYTPHTHTTTHHTKHGVSE